MDTQSLISIGLTKNEAELYLLTLNLGEATAADIARSSKLKRPTTYKTLDSLEAKSLLLKLKGRKKTTYQPAPPSTLLELAEKRQEELKRSELTLKTLLPHLTSAYTLSVDRPIVKVFEGVEGLKKIYMETLEDAQPILSFLQTQEVDPEMYKWLTTKYVEKRAAKKIPAKVIVASGKWSKEYKEQDIKEDRFSKIVDSTKFPFQHEVMIFGDKVAFVNYKRGENLIGIIIHHPQIAQTMKAIFDLSWSNIEKS